MLLETIFHVWIMDQNIELDGQQEDATHVQKGQLQKTIIPSSSFA